jgi:hypothetical protein
MTILLSFARAIATSALIGMLAACAAAQADAPVRGTMHTLAERQQVALGRTVLLRYEALADSRCPQGVACIWAGRISYRFSLTSPAGKEAFELTPGGAPFVATTLKHVAIALADQQPAGATRSVTVTVSAP